MYFTTLQVLEGTPLFLLRHVNHFIKNLNLSQISHPSFSFDDFNSFIKEKSVQKGLERLQIGLDANSRWFFKIKPEKPFEEKEIKLASYPDAYFETNSHLKQTASCRWDKLKQAQDFGCADWIFKDLSGFVLETSVANVFWIEKDKLCFPATDLPYYFGTTLTLILEVAPYLNLTLKPCYKKISKLIEADAVFYCNSLKGILSVGEIDHKKVKTSKSVLLVFQKALTQKAKEEGELLQNFLDLSV